MTKDMSDRIKSFGFLMTCVIVVYHGFFYGGTVNDFDLKINSAVDATAENLAFAAMCWFFSISGFLLFRNLTFKNFGEKLKRRAVTLLLPYFVWQLLVIVFKVTKLVLCHNTSELTMLFKDYFFNIFLMKDCPPDGALWYLYALFILTLLSPIILLLFKNKRLGWLAVIIITVLIYRLNYTENFITERIFTYGYLKNIISYFPAFLIGAFMGSFSKNSDGTDKLKYIISLLLTATVLESFYSGFIMDSVIKVLPMLILYFVPMFSVFRDRKIYCLSFLMYAIHKPLLVIRKYITPYLMNLLPYSFLGNITFRIIFLICVIAAAALIHFALRKASPKLLKVITGGRA